MADNVLIKDVTDATVVAATDKLTIGDVQSLFTVGIQSEGITNNITILRFIERKSRNKKHLGIFHRDTATVGLSSSTQAIIGISVNRKKIGWKSNVKKLRIET